MITVAHLARAAGVALISTLPLLVACDRDERAAPFETYLQRLGRTLDVQVPAPATPALPVAPRAAKLKLPVAPGNLGALDFLAISGCAVQVTIGKRNSSLGRMARDSQRLLLELEYLALAPDCIAYQRDQGNDELADTLEEAWRLKHQQLPHRIFNATLGGQEYREFWRARVPDAAYPTTAGSQVITALEAINGLTSRWLSGDYRADNLEFELLLSTVASGDGGQLMTALALQDQWLTAADRLLQQRMQRQPLCAPGYRDPAADILDNVIKKFFIGALQGDAAALGSRFHTLLPPLSTLESRLNTVLPEQYTTWQAQRDAILREFAAAPRRHVEQLKLLRAPCETG